MKTEKYDILARVLLYPSDAGGRKNPITARFWGCPMQIGNSETYNDCRLLLDKIGPLNPGDEVVVPIIFLCPELALPHLRVGDHFKLWEAGFKAKGEVLSFGKWGKFNDER